MRDVMRFGKKEKLSRQFVGHFEIQERVRKVAYRLTLPLSTNGIHEVFHISMLRKNVSDPSHI